MQEHCHAFEACRVMPSGGARLECCLPHIRRRLHGGFGKRGRQHRLRLGRLLCRRPAHDHVQHLPATQLGLPSIAHRPPTAIGKPALYCSNSCNAHSLRAWTVCLNQYLKCAQLGFGQLASGHCGVVICHIGEREAVSAAAFRKDHIGIHAEEQTMGCGVRPACKMSLLTKGRAAAVSLVHVDQGVGGGSAHARVLVLELVEQHRRK